jgi:hypothetical protein
MCLFLGRLKGQRGPSPGWLHVFALVNLPNKFSVGITKTHRKIIHFSVGALKTDRKINFAF